MRGISVAGSNALAAGRAGVDEALRHYLEGRVEPAVRILERAAREPSVQPDALRALAAILGTLDAMARLDPEFGRERRELRRRLLILAGSAERPAAPYAGGAGSLRA